MGKDGSMMSIDGWFMLFSCSPTPYQYLTFHVPTYVLLKEIEIFSVLDSRFSMQSNIEYYI